MSKEQTPKCYSDVKYDTSKCAGFSVGDCCQIGKEQTLTAEELYDLMASLSHSGRLDDRISTRVAEENILKWHNTKVLEHDKIQREKIAEVTKEVIQAKALEALEGFAKHLEKTGVFVMLDVEEYYETEVKQ
jgi:hypothetical protein